LSLPRALGELFYARRGRDRKRSPMSEEPDIDQRSTREIITGRRPGNGVLHWLQGAGWVCCLYGLFLFGLQCFYWLQNDVWISISIYDLLVGHPLRISPDPALASLGLDRQDPLPLRFVPEWIVAQGGEPGWLVAPQSWFGLHSMVATILKLLPFTLLSLAIGVLIVRLAWHYEEKFARGY
jgi:hypothetical protein